MLAVGVAIGFAAAASLNEPDGAHEKVNCVALTLEAVGAPPSVAGVPPLQMIWSLPAETVGTLCITVSLVKELVHPRASVSV